MSSQVDDLTVSHSPKACPVAGISSCSLNTVPHTEQWLPAVFPAFVQVADILASSTTVCPIASDVFTFCFICSLKFSLNAFLNTATYFEISGNTQVFFCTTVTVALAHSSCWYPQVLQILIAVHLLLLGVHVYEYSNS